MVSLLASGWPWCTCARRSRRPSVDARLHDATLYNSLYRFDDDLLVNTHAYGTPAGQSPVLHLRRLSGGRLFDHYMASFERVWQAARPVTEASEDRFVRA